MKYNIGQMIVTSSDKEYGSFFSDEKKMVKKGTKVFVSADKNWPSVIYENADIQPLPEGAEIEGYSTVGISEWLYSWLRRSIPLKDMLEDYDVSKDAFLEEIQTALEELGMYDNTGNRS
jgi:hypothetical protein